MAHREESRERVRTPLSVQLERRTMEGSRLIRQNLNSVFEELRPLMQPRTDNMAAGSSSRMNWIPRSSNVSSTPTPSTSSDTDLDSSFVINMDPEEQSNGRQSSSSRTADGSQTHSLPTTPTSPGSNFEPSSANAPGESNNNTNHEESVTDLFSLSPEASSLINIVKKYLPFVSIIVAKSIYDYIPAILLFIGLYGTFIFYNNRLKAEIAQHSQRNLGFLLFAVAHLVVTISCFYYLYDDLKLYLSLVFIPPYVQPLTVIDLLWLVAVTDFILKLITIIIKILVTLIPHSWFEAKRRGKWYLAIESSSQLYRSLVPIQPWLYYLLESYQGPQKVVGVFLSAAYMVSKGADLMARVRAWFSAMHKLLQNVQLGVSPDKDQLTSAGATCPICHDDYDSPVLLSCRHVFCESCVARWFDREQTCPLCRAKVVDDPLWRDGSTTHFAQLF